MPHRWLPEAALESLTLRAETPVRRRSLCLAGEDPAQRVLVTISYGGGPLPTAAATALLCRGLIEEVLKSLLSVVLSLGDEHERSTAPTSY